MGRVSPNPMVGCVIVKDGKIIGEGYHRKHGEAHAEVNAIESVKNKDLLKGSTLLVNLEPCSHYGKTPPCAERIIKEEIAEVIICNIDPNPLVSGRGINILKNAGINVECGILQEEGYDLNARFFTFHTRKRPYIILKWAQTSDGFIDGNFSMPIRISNDISKTCVHKLRAEEDAIMVGKNTALKDDPKLGCRRYEGKAPLRIAIDRNLEIPTYYNFYDNAQPTAIFNAHKDDGVRVKIDFNEDIIPQILDWLYENKIQSLIVEGGKFTLEQFIERGLFDAIQVEIGSTPCYSGVPAPTFSTENLICEVDKFCDSTFIHYKKVNARNPF
jgi:diaminohydroxyphosphoribosylaminopyrimidine deaminase/5-amino-6-(5-phosphoribosylamino)uracil reductase